MSHTFTDDDVDKRVETATADPIGVVTMTEADTAYVELDGSALDSIKATLGWESGDDEVVPIDAADVAEVTDDAIRLEAGAASEGDDGAADSASEREASTDPGDRTAAEGEGRSETGLESETEATEESGAERHPDGEDRPPQGDRTVTKERGEGEDR